MAPNVIAAAAHIAYDMQPPESLHRTKYQIKAKKTKISNTLNWKC